MLDAAAKLTVTWKGVVILDQYQTKFFPSPGRIVLACRTGDSNENTHMDNVKLVTTALEQDTVAPTAPANLAASDIGATHLALSWSPSTDNSGRVAYQIEKDGVVLGSTLVDTNYVDTTVMPNTEHTYKVRATDISGNTSAYTTPVTVTTAGEVASVGVLKAEIFTGITTGTTVQNLLDDPNFQENKPARVTYINGLEAGNENGNAGFNESFGDNYGMRITGTLIPSETGKYDFFIRSDDSSQFYLNTAGAALPVPGTDAPTVEEAACCSAFLEPGDATKPTVTTAEPISLTAGKAYGFVVLLKEGGGGDGVAVAWRKQGDTTPAGSLPFIKGTVLAGKQDTVGAVATITQAPVDTTAFANEKVSFKVAATTKSYYTANVVYQWYKNGAIIPGANDATYTIPVVPVSDNGSKYKVMVIASGAQATSSEATLTVNADTKLPSMVAVVCDDSLTKLTLSFSEPVTSPSATTAANYILDNGTAVTSATLVDAFTVVLTTARQVEGALYTLTVNNIKDNAGNAVAANSKFKFQSWGLLAGRAKMEQWNGISGTAVQNLLDSEKWASSAAPDAMRFIGGLTTGDNTGENFGDNYGARVKAYLIPSETADYHFFIRSDDASQLYLSQTDSFPEPGTDAPLIEETGCCSAFLEPNNTDKPLVTTSTPVSLVAGKKYPVVVLLKEGTGGDFVQVAWRKSSVTTAAKDLLPLTTNIFWYGGAAATNVLSTNDVIVSSHDAGRSPANEPVKNVLDGNSGTKYLNFGDGTDTSAPLTGITGFTVTPASGATVVTGIKLTTANDAPERDPLTYKIEGSLNGTTFTMIAEGTMPAVTNRFYSRTYTFANVQPFTVYKVTFPTVADNAKANSMQVADVALLGNGFGGVIAGPATKPALSIAKDATGKVVITFEGTLQSSDTANGTYADVAGTSPMTITPSGNKFYRARK